MLLASVEEGSAKIHKEVLALSSGQGSSTKHWSMYSFPIIENIWEDRWILLLD